MICGSGSLENHAECVNQQSGEYSESLLTSKCSDN